MLFTTERKKIFLYVFIIGLIVHIPAMVSDIPNHDGLSSMYFDQNMITSGRWFLTIACGFSSYFTLPWIIGLIGVFFVSLSAVVLLEILEADMTTAVLSGGILITFPALASTFAYVYTLDGYMMGLFLAVLAVYLTKKYARGFIPGGLCLAFSMGIYQSYLPFAIILSTYLVILLCIEEEEFKELVGKALRYAYMGLMGILEYYVILRLLLALQGKQLAGYQGIDSLDAAGGLQGNVPDMVRRLYADFATFVIRGKILFGNPYSATAFVLLILAFAAIFLKVMNDRGVFKRPFNIISILVLALFLPIGTNVILLISPDVNYHLLMRYQYALYPILIFAFVRKYSEGSHGLWRYVREGAVFAVAVMLFVNGINDNIGYSNLNKRYEKTYGYCLRLLDRIEQADGYYPGVPIAIVGVVGYVPYPETDITGSVTQTMTGLSGDQLLYTAANYQEFMKNYLGATLNFLTPEEMADIYYSEEYIAMESFPGKSSVKMIDGVLCVKTENVGRD